MTMIEKLQFARRALADPEIAAWYLEHHGVTPEMLTVRSVWSFGLAGLGEVASQIIDDGIEAGVISQDETA